MEDSNKESNYQVDELLSLVSLFKDTSVQRESGSRSLQRTRLLDIISHLNLKSILYSPLNAQSTRDPIPLISRLRTPLQLRTIQNAIPNSSNPSDHAFDLSLMSLSHMWSICGHRYLDHEQTITPCPTYCGMIDTSGRFIISGADDSLVKIWDVGSGKLLATLSGHTAEICDIAFSYDSEYIASLCTEDNSVIIWKRLEDHLYIFQRKLTEMDPSDISRRLSPLYMSFSPSDQPPSDSSHYLKLLIAYTNSTVVIHEFVNDNITEFNRIKPYFDNVELKSFALFPPSESDSVSFLIGVNRPSSGSIKSVLQYTARSRGIPRVDEIKFPNTSKSSIVHIAVANTSRSFLVADDEISTVVLYRESDPSQPKLLFKSFVAGDATLGFDQSSLIRRLREFCPSHHIEPSLRISTDIAIFSINDEFILCTIAGTRRNPSQEPSLGDDDASSIYCCLVFSSFSCQLVGVIGLGKNRDNLFNVAPIKPPSSVTGSSYFAIGGHDGLFTIYKIFFTPPSHLVVIELTEFQIDERGSNRPRMILDCAVLEKPDGELLAMITDAKGTISCFSSLNRKTEYPSEQFFHNDYFRTGQPLPLGTVSAGIEVGNGRTTTTENGGVVCDTRLVPLTDLQIPSPHHVDKLIGSGFAHRFSGPIRKNFVSVFKSAPLESTASTRVVDIPATPHIPTSVVPDRRQGRPPLPEEERQRRAESLRNLAAARAAQTGGDSPEYVRTASGRIIRSMNSRPIHENEFELYENSEIDDSDYTDDSEDSSERHRRSRRRETRTVTESPPVRRGGRMPRPEGDDLVVVPLRMNAKDYVDRIRSLQAGRRDSCSQACTLCGAPEIIGSSDRGDLVGYLLGPFPIADIGNAFFHEECLFTLSKLRVVPQVSTRVTWNATLTFANLDRLVSIAKTEGKCYVCKSMGAGIKCCRCRKVVHYLCGRRAAMERETPLILDPALDGFYICHLCELPPDAKELTKFSLRPAWRREADVRDWMIRCTKRSNILQGVFVPQIGDLVYYYPPKIPPGADSSAVASVVCHPGGQNTFQAMTDLSLLAWWNNPHGYVAGRVEKIEYKFPSFFDAESYKVYQVLTIMITGTSNDVNTFEGFRFKVHYRPKSNGSDFIVPQLRVSRFLLSGFDRRAKSGDEVIVPMYNDNDEITREKERIDQVVPDSIRPGWECFRIRDEEDNTASYSLWELEIPGVDLNDPTTLVPGISAVKARYMSQWLGAIMEGGAIQNSRNRIDLEEGLDIFAYQPWLTPGVETYAEFIVFPMYMSLIKERLDGGYYRYMDELRKDVTLISTNCEAFNDPSSVFVAQAKKLVSTLLKLLDLSEADHSLCMPPRLNNTQAAEPVSAIRIRTSATSRNSVDTIPHVNSVRVSRKKSLTCDRCGALRDVDYELYSEYRGKKIECEWIGFGCEPVSRNRIRSQSLRRNTAPPPQINNRSIRRKRALRGRHSDDASSMTEDSESSMSESESDSISDSESDSGSSTPTARRRSTRTSPNKRYRRR